MSANAGGTWGAGRRAWAWVHLSLQVAFLLGFLVLVNLIARKAGGRYDLTTLRVFGLDPVMEDALRRLDYDLQVWFTPPEFAPGAEEDKSMKVAWARTYDLLEECRKRTDRIQVTYVNPLDRGEGARLQRHWPQVVPNTLYLLADHGPDRTGKKTVDLAQLYEGDPRTGAILEYRGQGVLLQALRELAVGTKRVVYQTFSHKELLAEDPRSMSVLSQYLAAHEAIEFRRLDTAGNLGVPDDAMLVAVLGPAAEFQPGEVDILRGYLERGGSLFVAVRPRVTTGLEGLLEEYGVRADTRVIVHDLLDCVPPRLSHLRVRRFNAHEINRIMANAYITMPDACTVDPVEKGPGWTTIPLAQSGPESWGEKGDVGVDANPRPDGDERRGQQNLIVAVEKTLPAGPDGKPRKAKLVAWGSAYPLTNSGLSPGGHLNQYQLQYLINTFRWLMDREMMEIGGARVMIEPIQMSPGAISQVRWITILGFPLVGVVLGLMAFFFRRK